jgi:hypothetical protein
MAARAGPYISRKFLPTKDGVWYLRSRGLRFFRSRLLVVSVRVGGLNGNTLPAWKAIGSGDFDDDGQSDILFQNASTDQVSIWEMNGSQLVVGGAVSANAGPS